MSTDVPSEISGLHWSVVSPQIAALHRGDRLLQHRLVQLEADLADVAGLLLAQQVAGAADVEIVGGQREAGAQRIERLQHLQALLGAFASASCPAAW